MKNIFKFASILLLGCALALNVSCSGDDDGGHEDQLGKVGTMTMKIDGKLWVADVATVITMSDDEVEDGEAKAYWVNMTGIRAKEVDSEELTESISLSLLLSKTEFENPKRSYPVANMGDSNSGHALIMYHDVGDIGQIGRGVFVSSYPTDSDQAVGNITVKGYKIGDQTFFGQSLGKGYTEFSGTFEAELYSFDEEDNPLKMTITEGKFNLHSDLLSGLGI